MKRRIEETPEDQLWTKVYNWRGIERMLGIPRCSLTPTQVRSDLEEFFEEIKKFSKRMKAKYGDKGQS